MAKKAAPKVKKGRPKRQLAPIVKKSSPLHRLSVELQTRGHVDSAARVRTGEVMRVVLTGGPCAGKSSALPRIIETAKDQGFDVYTGPETATLLRNCGVVVPSTLEGLQIFQMQVFRMQIQMESALKHMAEETGRPSIIIFDRGVMDGKAYMPEDLWNANLHVFDAENTPEDIEEELLSRYEVVVHMVTAADGAEQFYKSGQTLDDTGKWVLRGESADEAVQVDKKQWEVWKDHPRHIRVENGPASFDAKLAEVSDCIVDAANERAPTFVVPSASGPREC